MGKLSSFCFSAENGLPRSELGRLRQVTSDEERIREDAVLAFRGLELVHKYC